MATDNTVLNAGTGGDTVRDLARQAGTVKTPVVQLDIGGPSANAEVLVLAGQQTKAASVPVVIASDQGALTVQGQQSSRSAGTITNATSVVGPISANNFNICTVTISGTFTGVTALFEGTDDGTNWYPMQGCRTDVSVVETGPTLLSSTNRAWDIAVGGMTQLRVRATAWGSGTANVGMTFQAMPYEPSPAAGISSIGGTSLLAKAVPTGGSGMAAIPVYTNAVQCLTYTYGIRAITTGLLTANTAKQIASLEVAAVGTKTVKIRRILISGFQTGTAVAGPLDIQLSRGTAASSGGTVVTAGVRVAGDTAASAVVKSLPTIVAATVLDVLPFAVDPTAVSGTHNAQVIYDWQEDGETKPWTLKPGVIDSLVLSAISSAAQTWTLTIHITTTEE